MASYDTVKEMERLRQERDTLRSYGRSTPGIERKIRNELDGMYHSLRHEMHQEACHAAEHSYKSDHTDHD